MEAPSRRDRVRASTVEEIKATARRLMAEAGTTDVRFSDIARSMGMTGPALYRYYADRDALLTDLISDGYDDLASSLEQARSAEGELAEQFGRFGQTYRAWGLADPVRYALVFGMPIAGYAAPPEGTTVTDARRAMGALVGLLDDAAEAGTLDAPTPTGDLGAHLSEMMPGVATDRHQVAMHIWMSLHGFVSLEAFGHLDMVPAPARDELFAAHLRLNGHALGLFS